MIENVTAVSYVAVSILFILALAGLSSQKRAKVGNFMGMAGMTIALVATLADRSEFTGDVMFWLCVIPGASVGLLLAHRVAMVSMPQLVAALHSFVGLAAVLVGIANLLHHGQLTEWNNMVIIESLETFIGVFIGAITFTGSIVAYGKLEGKIRSNPLILWGWVRHVINASCCGVCVLFCIIYVYAWDNEKLRLVLLLTETGIAFFVGWHLVMAIGGADMPVVVSMLNSYSGWATAAAGFMLNNDAMIVTGALVGSSGAILSYIMCEAMNRGFISVIMGGFGGEVAVVAQKDDGIVREHKTFNVKQTAEALLAAQDIVIIPGYGLAVARGQHAVAEIVTILRGLGKNVRFAIHPVAGRLPGHMNVLLAEANVPYDIVLSMEEINDDMPKTDVCIVVGANDIVNPIALTDPTCPIAGMPIIECFKSKLTIVNKRSMASGYAGIDNPLFYYENTRMFFGDAKKAFDELLEELRKHKVDVDVKKADENTPLMAGQEEKVDLAALPAAVRVIGVPKEVAPQERMVALTPATALQLRKKGYGIIIEAGAGAGASFPDQLFIDNGCQIVNCAKDVYELAQIVLKVQPPTKEECALFHGGQTLISFFYPARNPEMLKELQAKGVNVVAMDMVPRTSKAQKLDALSSLSNLAGYRSVIEASHMFGRLFTGQITAAGKMPPAVVFVIGAGVAGLAAIGTAKSLGAVVKAFDIRKSVKEQIESMGGEFLPVPIDEDTEDASGYAKGPSAAFIKAEMELFARTCPVVDVIITTAAIPGKRAPIFITKDMVNTMRPGSVIVDLAAGTGGNCELTQPGKTICYNNVYIIGDTDLVSRMASQASSLYSQNLRELIAMMGEAAAFNVDVRDESIRQMTCCKDGEMLFPPPQISVSAAGAAKKKPTPPMSSSHAEKKDEGYTWTTAVVLAALALLLALMIFFVPYGFITHFMDFVLAIIVGYHVIWSVTPALHTPLMSETNAISGIIVVGGMLELAPFSQLSISVLLGAIATSIATINIAGGFYVTYRMLQMFH